MKLLNVILFISFKQDPVIATPSHSSTVLNMRYEVKSLEIKQTLQSHNLPSQTIQLPALLPG